MSRNYKNVRAKAEFFSVQVGRTFLKVCAPNPVKVTRLEEVTSKSRRPILTELFLKFRH